MGQKPTRNAEPRAKIEHILLISGYDGLTGRAAKKPEGVKTLPHIAEMGFDHLPEDSLIFSRRRK